MKVKALKSFSGAVSMSRGQEKEISDKYLLSDLLNAGYVVEAKDTETAEKPKKKAKKAVM